MLAPCKDCKERYFGCHDECVKYQAYQNKVEEIRQRRQDEVRTRSYICDEVFKNVRRYKSYVTKKGVDK